MRIVIGSDHAGFHLKNRIRDWLRAEGHDVTDVGTSSPEATDYPVYAERVGKVVTRGDADRGILICGTGAGSCIAVNKVRGVRGCAVSEPVTARLLRSHNDANVICLGERIVGVESALEIVRVFVATEFSGAERHMRRIGQIAEIENSQMAEE